MAPNSERGVVGTVTVIIVDDDEQVGQTLGRIVERQGMAVVNMPGQSGISLLHQIASDAIDVPVVMVSGFASPTILAEALGLGASGYVTKPLDRP
jgi:FixJ family two-component response regulator